MSFEDKEGCGIIIAAILVIIACLFIIPAILMWLWNSCVVGWLPVGEIESYWQAMGIYVVSNILFKSTRSNISKE
jgi:Flp pilus assembly protein TadB